MEPWGSLDVDAPALVYLPSSVGREIVAADSTENWSIETFAEYVGAAAIVRV